MTKDGVMPNGVMPDSVMPVGVMPNGVTLWSRGRNGREHGRGRPSRPGPWGEALWWKQLASGQWRSGSA